MAITTTPSRFVIEDGNAITKENFINKIFTTTTVNNTKSSATLSQDIVDNYESIQSKKPTKILNTVRGISGKKYELDRHDLREVLESIFPEDSDIFKALAGIVDAIDSAEMAILNGIIAASNVLNKVTGALCNLAALLLGLSLALPLIRLLDALLGLTLLAASKCQYLIYAALMDAIESDDLKKLLSIKLIHGALDYDTPELLVNVLNHPSNENLSEEANWLPDLVAGTVKVDASSNVGSKKEFVPIPYPEWYDDLYGGLTNIDNGYNVPPNGTVDENGDPVSVTSSGPFWDLSPLKYSPAYIAFARQHRTEITVVSEESLEPTPLTPITIANIHATNFKEAPDMTIRYT